MGVSGQVVEEGERRGSWGEGVQEVGGGEEGGDAEEGEEGGVWAAQGGEVGDDTEEGEGEEGEPVVGVLRGVGLVEGADEGFLF
jgi:hypothetical protein